MKTGKALSYLLALLLIVNLLAACGGDSSRPAPSTKQETLRATEAPAAPSEESTALTPSGQIYSTGEFQAPVPEGWAAFPISDVFAETAGTMDTSCFNIIKGGTGDLDLFSKSYVRLDYYGPDTLMLKPGSDWYENVTEVAPMQLGPHTWSGFIGENDYGRLAVLWAEEGSIQYQATVWLEIGNQTITLDDADVQTILAGVSPCDATAGSTGNLPVATGNFDWWEDDWYGWWCIKNGTGIYEPASNVAWDAYAEIDVYDDNTGRVTLWDTGTSKAEPLICAYDVTYHNGASEQGKLVSRRVVFFPTGYWNQGTEASTMDERTIGWTVDPAVSTVNHFTDMLEITGHYTSPDNSADSFDYFIYLRPWGTIWEDVRNGDTTGCIYKDMMPLYHDNWYVSLLNLGYEHPTSTFEEGIDIINRVINGGTPGEPLDPADKEGADGIVDMATLKRMLPWCKKETTYSTTYDEIAAQFGVHGKRKESTFENHVYYLWIASETDYIQIGFDVHPDGTETWNVTQWWGID